MLFCFLTCAAPVLYGSDLQTMVVLVHAWERTKVPVWPHICQLNRQLVELHIVATPMLDR